MQGQSRRSFCRLCIMAGAAIGPGLSLSHAIPLSRAAEPLKEPRTDGNSGNRAPDYSLIGYCGYRCDLCAGRSEDKNVRRKMVAGWKKLYGHTMYTEENVPIARPCAGCKGKGEVADTSCRARGCAAGKKVVLCADCGEFPCEKVKPLLSGRSRLLLNCLNKDVSREEYVLSAMQFESIPVLLGRMVETGRFPSWMKDLL